MSAYEDKISQCQTLLNYTFKDSLLCLEALQTFSSPLSLKGKYRVITKNDRLAVLGDTVLKSYLCTKWYEAGRSKGEWSTAEQTVVRNTNLAHVGFEKGLQECVILYPGTPSVSEKTMAATVEALIGAVYRDSGMDGLSKIVDVLGLDHEYLHEGVTNAESTVTSERPVKQEPDSQV